MRRLPVTLALVLVVALVAACSGDDDGDDASPTATTTTTESSDESSDADVTIETTTTAASGTSCTTPVERDEPSNEGEVVDLDGDGRPDTVWAASPGGGRRVLGVETAAGGGAKVDIESASPVAIQVLVADADGTPPVELFVSDNRSVQLWAFDDCALQPVTDPDGRPYVFDLGLRGYGTGVGCVDGNLVGLDVTSDNPAGEVHWTSTIITRDALTADEGETTEGTYRHPTDDAAIALLHQVTCNDLTMAENGIPQPEE